MATRSFFLGQWLGSVCQRRTGLAPYAPAFGLPGVLQSTSLEGESASRVDEDL